MFLIFYNNANVKNYIARLNQFVRKVTVETSQHRGHFNYYLIPIKQMAKIQMCFKNAIIDIFIKLHVTRLQFRYDNIHVHVFQNAKDLPCEARRLSTIYLIATKVFL